MKIYFIVLILLISSFTWAQEAEYDYTGIETDMSGIAKDRVYKNKLSVVKEDFKESIPTGIQIDRKDKRIQPTAEWHYTYLRFSESKLSFLEKEQGSSLTIGHRQVADSFYYDLQYNSLKSSSSKTNVQSALMGFGWQASWAHRLKPYVGLQVGYSWLKSKKLDLSETGFYSGIDAGVILMRQYPFLFMVGTRFGVHNYSSEEVRNVTTQELYLSIGVEFY